MKPLDRNISISEHIVAHSYGTVDPEIIWEIISDDIPVSKQYCSMIIASA